MSSLSLRYASFGVRSHSSVFVACTFVLLVRTRLDDWINRTTRERTVGATRRIIAYIISYGREMRHAQLKSKEAAHTEVAGISSDLYRCALYKHISLG